VAERFAHITPHTSRDYLNETDNNVPMRTPRNEYSFPYKDLDVQLNIANLQVRVWILMHKTKHLRQIALRIA